MVSMNLILIILILPPVLMLSFLVERKTRALFIFLAVGVAAAYISGQINTVFAASGIDPFYISIHISPIIEEFLKAFPVGLYLFALKPTRKTAISCAAATGLGFAFFENAWAFSQCAGVSPSFSEISFALSRGFGASLVHSLCTLILVYGISVCLKTKKLLYTGTFALFSLVCIFHSLFNVLVQSPIAIAPFLLTLGVYAAIAVIFMAQKKRRRQEKDKLSQSETK